MVNLAPLVCARLNGAHTKELEESLAADALERELLARDAFPALDD
jgi:hypothetical protein